MRSNISLFIQVAFFAVTFMTVGGLFYRMFQNCDNPYHSKVSIDKVEHFVDGPVVLQESRGVSGSGLSVKNTKVVRHDGTAFQTLPDFCTWTVPLDCAILKTDDGPMPIYIHRIADDYSSRLIAEHGTKQQSYIRAIFSEFENYPDAGFIDVGSHVGLFSLQAAKKGRRVISVDPLVENVQRLCKSAQRNGLASNVTIVFNAISDERKLVTFKKRSGNVGETRILADSEPSGVAGACDVTPPMYSVLLDDVLPFLTFNTALLKIDVESHEFHVIKGGQEFFNRVHVPAILMEWLHVKKRRTVEPLVGLMKKLKYVPYNPLKKQVALKSVDYLTWPDDVLWLKEK